MGWTIPHGTMGWDGQFAAFLDIPHTIQLFIARIGGLHKRTMNISGMLTCTQMENKPPSTRINKFC